MIRNGKARTKGYIIFSFKIKVLLSIVLFQGLVLKTVGRVCDEHYFKMKENVRIGLQLRVVFVDS